MMRSHLNITTVNVKGINDPEKMDQAIKWTIDNEIDILLLSETKINLQNASFNFKHTLQANFDFNPKTPHSAPLLAIWSHNENHPRGNGIGMILNAETIGNHFFKKSELPGRCLSIFTKHSNKQTIVITCIYGPADKDRQTKKDIVSFIKKLPRGDNISHIIGGDLNEAPNHTHTPIHNALTEMNLVNTHWISKTPHKHTFRHPTHDTNSQIDHLFISSQLLPREQEVLEHDIAEYFITDHTPVSAKIWPQFITTKRLSKPKLPSETLFNTS